MILRPTLLILGASGLLAKRYVEYLNKTSPTYNFVSQSRSPGFDYQLDPLRFEELESLIMAVKPSVILNFIALADVELCEKSPENANLLNCILNQKLSELMNKHESHIIYISTDHVYDQKKFNKEEEIVLRNHYARSKYAGEIALSQNSNTILRVNFFGKSISEKQSFSDWIYQVIVEKKHVKLFTDNLFTALNMNTLCKVIDHVVKQPKVGTFNVAPTTSMSKADFCIMFSKKIGKTIESFELTESKIFPERAPRPHFTAMDSLKFQKTFNWKFDSMEFEIEQTAMEYIK